MTASTLRYQLPKKAIKTDCPACGPKHRKTLSRYVDTRTDEALPDPFGRCATGKVIAAITSVRITRQHPA